VSPACVCVGREREREHECVFVLGVCRVCVSVCAFARGCSLSPERVCVCVRERESLSVYL